VLRDRRRRSSSRQSRASVQETTPTSASTSARPIYRIGGTTIRDDSISRATTPVNLASIDGSERPSTPVLTSRTIRFPDEEQLPRSSLEGQAAA